MQEAVPAGAGAMAAIMGLDLAAAEAVCAEAARGEVVEVANANSPAQVVIAGHRGAVERAVQLASARGGKGPVIGSRTNAEVRIEIPRKRQSITHLLKGRWARPGCRVWWQCNA